MQRESAKPKARSVEDEPSFARMSQDVKPADRKQPTTDQRKWRRQQRRQRTAAQNLDGGYDTRQGNPKRRTPGLSGDYGSGRGNYGYGGGWWGWGYMNGLSQDSMPAKSWNMDDSDPSSGDGADAVSGGSGDSGGGDGGGTTASRRSAPTALRCVACRCACAPGADSCGACGSLMVEAYSIEDFGRTVREAYEHAREVNEGTEHTATTIQRNVADAQGNILLNSGDQIQTPTGQTMKVRNVRRHETSRQHFYVDTDAGTTLVPGNTNFQVSPDNQRQQELPGFGSPGGNTNQIPFGQKQDASNEISRGSACPNCGRKGTLRQSGQDYVCSACGFRDNNIGGHSFSDSTSRIQTFTSRSGKPRTAIARRAAEVYAEMEGRAP